MVSSCRTNLGHVQTYNRHLRARLRRKLMRKMARKVRMRSSPGHEIVCHIFGGSVRQQSCRATSRWLSK